MSEWIKNTGEVPCLVAGTTIDVWLVGSSEHSENYEVEEFAWHCTDSVGSIDKWRVHKSDIGINPKQALGQASLPLNLFSPLATAYGSIGKLNGKLKYGLSNFVATPVIASIYCDAIRRHLDKWMAGQENDLADGVPHFAAMLANIDILICARAAGTLVDDRPLIKGYEAEMEKLTPLVKQLHELHKDKNPHHHLLSEANAE